MIPKPTFQIVGQVTGQMEFSASERKPKGNVVSSTFESTNGNRKFYILRTMGGDFPITLTDELKDAMKDGKIYRLTGELESIRGGLTLRVRFIEESDEMQYMLSVPQWEAIGVVSSVDFDEERQTHNVILSIPGVALRFYGVPKGKVMEESKGQLAKVTGNLATRNNQRTGSTNIDTQFGNLEHIDPKDALTTSKPEPKKVNGKQPEKQPA